ncbi:hypothetical protein C4G38_RS10430 [Vibrio parahaemolyticus]|nr:hypothetical protein [Vibrio parahaemolyticus]EJG0737874.1 hypothetical protein [Vibrio parahaemolyticus]EJG0916342.1 hypothetical protein [Vibrio parahaemolyticus]
MLHKFVEFIPENIEQGTLYISMQYATAMHKCACGCGNIVVTPFSPTDWKLLFNGDSVSLSLSIGNWSFPCRSHYFIRNDQVDWCSAWSKKQIQNGREADKKHKNEYYNQLRNNKKETFIKVLWLNIKKLLKN